MMIKFHRYCLGFASKNGDDNGIGGIILGDGSKFTITIFRRTTIHSPAIFRYLGYQGFDS
jgi:hypothetical protein